MKRLLPLAVAAFTLFACGPTKPQVCDSVAKATCAKMWGCMGVQGLKIGSDEATCLTQYASLCSLGAADQTALDKGLKCATDLGAQSCDQYKMGQPASCSSN